MERTDSTPGPKPFPWNPNNGPVKNAGHKAPSLVHDWWRTDEGKKISDACADSPELTIQVLGLLEKP